MNILQTRVGCKGLIGGTGVPETQNFDNSPENGRAIKPLVAAK